MTAVRLSDVRQVVVPVSLSLALMLIVGGCQSETASTVTAVGQVNVGGEPFSGGVVTLEPISPTTGPNASVPVFQGAFEIPASAGLHGGRYRVRVSMIPAEIRKSIPGDPAMSLPPDDAVIDPAYDAASQLTCELKPDQDNALAFAVEFLK